MTSYFPPADALIAIACEQTGLHDFGGDSFREGLEVFCRSCAEEAQLNGFGATAIPGAIVNVLMNRLRVIDWIRTHPEVTRESIEAPIFVVGMFRAGTTLLTYLLEKDARHRPLMRWETGDCVPPASPGSFRNDARIEVTRASMAMMDQINPRMRIVQSEEPDGPTECISVLNQEFKSLVWEAMANVPAYGAWLHQTDHRSAYQHHKRVLEVLQSGGVRGRWSLKSPHHILHLDALTAVYPDARIVVTHRDPRVLCASVCSLLAALTGTFSDADHRRTIGAHWSDMLARSVEALDRFRDAHPAVQIADVQYADLARDPIAALQGVYAAFDDTLDSQALQAMTAHVQSHAKHRFGKHRYDLAEFGLKAGEIEERFRSYIERYDVPLEAFNTA